MLKYKDFSLIKPTQEQSKTILNLINEKNGSVFHEVDLNKTVSEEFNSDLYYLVDNPQNIQNFTPVHITQQKKVLKRYELKPLYDIPYAGFLDDSEIDFSKISCGSSESIVYNGFPKIAIAKENISINRVGETCYVDLNLDEDEIFSTVIHSKRRNMIRKADKSGVIVKTYFTSEGLDYFWPLLSILHDKLNYNHLKKTYYKKIIDFYGPKKQAFITIAFQEEKPISGVFVLGNKNYMMYYKGASSFEVKNIGQGERLQWEAIKVSKSLGTKYYDLGNLQQEALPAIYKFKTGISSNIVNYHVFSYHGNSYKLVNKFVK